MRKCRFKDCGKQIPPLKKSKEWQEKGFCDFECVVRYGHKKGKAKIKRDQAKQRVVIQRRNTDFKRRVKLDNIKDQKDLTQTSFNKLIKLEELLRCSKKGINPICISCSKDWTQGNNSDFAAGHYSSRGSDTDLALNNKNVYLQCNMRCNSALAANKNGTRTTHGYDEGLIMRLGEEAYGKLIRNLEQKRQTIKWLGKDYKVFRKWISGRISVIKKELEMFYDMTN